MYITLTINYSIIHNPEMRSYSRERGGGKGEKPFSAGGGGELELSQVVNEEVDLGGHGAQAGLNVPYIDEDFRTVCGGQGETHLVKMYVASSSEDWGRRASLTYWTSSAEESSGRSLDNI